MVGAVELAAPVQALRSRRGQRHLPGRWWSATGDGHVGYESWLERDHVILLDFDRRGRQIAGRFTVVPAAPFAYGTSEQRETWRALEATMKRTLRLHQHTPGILVESISTPAESP